MRVIKVYGSLAKFLGQRSFKAAVDTPLEAIRFLIANFPKVEAHIAENHYKISVGRNALQIGDQPELLTYPTAEFEPIRIIPVLEGAGSSGGAIAAGIGLVALAILTAPLGGGFLGLGAGAFTSTTGTALVSGAATGFAATGFLSAASAVIGSIGVGLALTGVSGLLSPTSAVPSGANSSYDPRKSYSFSGVQNVARQGVPVPVVYGEVVVGSIVISSGVDTESVRG